MAPLKAANLLLDSVSLRMQGLHRNLPLLSFDAARVEVFTGVHTPEDAGATMASIYRNPERGAIFPQLPRRPLPDTPRSQSLILNL